MIRLPVSGVEVELRPITGAEDVLLVETPAPGGRYSPANCARVMISLLERLARTADGPPCDCSALPVADLDAMLLFVRRECFGDLVRAESTCPAEGCGARIDVEFGIGDYLAHHAPQRARLAKREEPDGPWFRFEDAPIRFRIPTGADLLAARGSGEPDRTIMARCVCPARLPARAIRRVENALEALAPSLAGSLRGQCPECGAGVDIAFGPRGFVLRELREQAAFVYEDVHLLASVYQWSESAILALPRGRRIAYAELIRQQEGRV